MKKTLAFTALILASAVAFAHARLQASAPANGVSVGPAHPPPSGECNCVSKRGKGSRSARPSTTIAAASTSRGNECTGKH